MSGPQADQAQGCILALRISLCIAGRNSLSQEDIRGGRCLLASLVLAKVDQLLSDLTVSIESVSHREDLGLCWSLLEECC